MQTDILMVDTKTDGGLLAKCDLSVKHNTSGNALVLLIEEIAVELHISLSDIGTVLDNDLHG